MHLKQQTSTAFMRFLLFACIVNTLSTIIDILISFKHERHKAVCGSLVGFIYFNLATQHCWNEHFQQVLHIFNPNHTKDEVHMGAAITSDVTKSLIVGHRFPGQYISRNVETYYTIYHNKFK